MRWTKIVRVICLESFAKISITKLLSSHPTATATGDWTVWLNVSELWSSEVTLPHSSGSVMIELIEIQTYKKV